MKAIILCGGTGTRIKDFHQLPKAFIEIDKKLLIEHSLNNLDGFVDEVFIVIGNMGGMFKQRLGSRYKSMKLTYIPTLDSRGMAESFYHTKGYVDDDVIVLEGDLLYEKRAISNLINFSNRNAIVTSSISGSGDEVYVKIEKPDIVRDLGKHIPKTEYEYIGMARLSGAFFNDCINEAEKEENRTKYFEEIIMETSKKRNILLSSCFIKDLIWCDIDTEDDYKKALNIYHKMKNVKILLNPAPATTTESVKMAQVVPDICPREKEFCDLMDGIRKDLVKIVHGDENYTSILFSGSGTSVMDATMNSVIEPSKKVLIINNGSYCERLKQICEVYKIDYKEIKFDYEIDVEKVKEQLDGVDYVAMVHHETTSGIINPVEEIGKLCKERDLTFIVDCISSFAGVEIDIKKMNIHFLLGSSNKCIQGMAGIGFVVCDKGKLFKTKDFRRSFYLNLWNQYDYFEKTGQMQFTPPVQCVYALRQAIDEYFAEGEVGRIHRYKKSHKVLNEGLNKLGFKTKGGYILSTVYTPKGFDFNRVHDDLYNRGFTIYPSKSGTDTFRLANIGAIDHKDIEKFLIAFEEVIRNQGQS